MKSKRLTSVIGIELTQDRLAAVEVILKERTCCVQRTLDAPLSIDVTNTDADLAGREIRSKLDVAGIRSRSCVLCLPAEHVLVQTIDLKGVPEADIDSLISLEAERAFPFNPEDMLVACSRFEDTTGAPRATLAAIAAGHLTPIVEALKKAKLKLVGITLSATALLNLQSGSVNAAILVDGGALQFTASTNLGVALIRSLSLGSEPTANGEKNDDIAQYDELARELRLTLRRLPGDLRSNLKQVRLFGRVPLSPALKETISSELADAGLRSVDAGVTQTAQLTDSGPQQPYPALIRAASQVLSGHPSTLEFWRPQEARWRIQLRRLLERGLLVRLGLAAGALAILIIGAFIIQSLRLSSLERRWNSVRPDVERLQAIQSGIHDRRPWLSSDPERLEILRALTSAFPETGSVWVRSVEIRETDSVECVGFARSNQDCLSTLESLRSTGGVSDLQVSQVRGDKPIQFSFQYVWKKENSE